MESSTSNNKLNVLYFNMDVEEWSQVQHELLAEHRDKCAVAVCGDLPSHSLDHAKRNWSGVDVNAIFMVRPSPSESVGRNILNLIVENAKFKTLVFLEVNGRSALESLVREYSETPARDVTRQDILDLIGA